MFGIHIRIVNSYGDYKTVTLFKKGRERIWLNKLPESTAVMVVCEKCGKKYFIKYKKHEKYK